MWMHVDKGRYGSSAHSCGVPEVTERWQVRKFGTAKWYQWGKRERKEKKEVKKETKKKEERKRKKAKAKEVLIPPYSGSLAPRIQVPIIN